MKLNKSAILVNVIGFVILGLLSLVFGMAGVGALAILFGVVNLFLGLIFLPTSYKTTSATCLLIGGLLLLTGFALCSSFKFIG